jgi:hypothetical protein
MIVGAFSYYQNVDILIIKIQIKLRTLINRIHVLKLLTNRLNDYMGYREDVVEILLTSATKEQKEYFDLVEHRAEHTTNKKV